MIPFTESHRYEYPLTSDSLVVEIGGYTGGFAKTMAEKYGCRVLSFEPVKRFFEEAVRNNAKGPLRHLVRMENYGVSDKGGDAIFGIHGELTGIAASGEHETVHLLSIGLFFSHPWIDGRTIDVLSINAEGSEYPILEAILDRGVENRFLHLQVQPHSVVPDAANRWAKIRERLLMSFRITSEDPNLDNGWLLLERK